jgi:predicted nucleic acid-binding protein
MTLYLDTSTLVKLYLDEPDAEEIQDLVDEARVLVTSSLAYSEARATFARRRREKHMTAAEVTRAIAQLDADWSRFIVVEATDELARAAGQLADAHALRGADAIHLASFETLLSRCEDPDVRMSCADERLARAARELG